jgi:uncharacterized cupredoxin-like copper-binding protein
MRGLVRPGLLLVVCALSCCGAGSSSNADDINVTLQDFSLRLPATSTKAGTVSFRLHNDGPSTHEFNIDRTDRDAGDLPIRADGLSVDEASNQMTRIDSVEIIEADDTAHLTVNLPAGHYVLYCNLEGHYLGHMYANFDVN